MGVARNSKQGRAMRGLLFKMCMHMFVYVGNVCVETRVQPQVCSFGAVYLGFLRQGLFLTWNFPSRRCWLATEPQDLPISGSPALAI